MISIIIIGAGDIPVQLAGEVAIQLFAEAEAHDMVSPSFIADPRRGEWLFIDDRLEDPAIVGVTREFDGLLKIER